MPKRLALLLLVWLPVPTHSVRAQTTQGLDVLAALRAEADQNSQVQRLAHELVEVIGPRLTGSPAMRRAEEWVIQQMREWSVTEARMEPWGRFGKSWEPGIVQATMTRPFRRVLQAQPIAWTSGTDGVVQAPVVAVPAASTDATGMALPDTSALESLRGRLRGAVVLLGPVQPMGPDSVAPEPRWDADDLLPEEPYDRSARPANAAAALGQIDALLAGIATAHAERDRMLREAGVVAILSPSQRPHGVLRGSGNWSGFDPATPDPLPELVIAAEHFNEMWRNVQAGEDVRVELEIESHFGPVVNDGNVIADLRGHEFPEQYVVLGAHLDSWHLGGGATDNAAGSVVMMEAIRLLRAVGVEPRRTIRVALWSGEEEGLFGSREWVAAHPELHGRISAYLNMDNGTGRIRGVRNEGFGAAIGWFEDILPPVSDLGVVGVIEASSGGSDHLPFLAAGIPAFTFLQDPMEYNRRTHHSALDGYDHLSIEDLRQSAVVVAWIAYRLAMADDLMPRE